jgi:hypothetical protein
MVDGMAPLLIKVVAGLQITGAILTILNVKIGPMILIGFLLTANAIIHNPLQYEG